MNSQKGLTLIEILIATAVVIVIGIGGAYFFDNKEQEGVDDAVYVEEPSPTTSAVPAPGFTDVDEMIVVEDEDDESDTTSIPPATPDEDETDVPGVEPIRDPARGY